MVDFWLDLITRDQFDVMIIEGCARGADAMAEDWWRRHVWSPKQIIQIDHHPADWGQYGKAAGPIRNREMLNCEPDLIVAFHSNIENSKGTKDMVTIGKNAGVPVVIISG